MPGGRQAPKGAPGVATSSGCTVPWASAIDKKVEIRPVSPEGGREDVATADKRRRQELLVAFTSCRRRMSSDGLRSPTHSCSAQSKAASS